MEVGNTGGNENEKEKEKNGKIRFHRLRQTEILSEEWKEKVTFIFTYSHIRVFWKITYNFAIKTSTRRSDDRFQINWVAILKIIQPTTLRSSNSSPYT